MEGHLLDKKAITSSDEREKLIDIIFDLFNQACRIDTPDGYKYHHMFISAYEEAQRFLIAEGIILKNECYYDA